MKRITKQIAKLKFGKYVEILVKDRQIFLVINESELEECSRLDGCYVIKTDLIDKEGISKQEIHTRYKSLKEVEWAFRTQKTSHLAVRPIYLRKAERTKAHLLIVMLAYKIEKHLRSKWISCTKVLGYSDFMSRRQELF